MEGDEVGEIDELDLEVDYPEYKLQVKERRLDGGGRIRMVHRKMISEIIL